MNDYRELKRLAEAAREESDWQPTQATWEYFNALRDPAAVLALIAENEALRGIFESIISEMPHANRVTPGNSPGHCHSSPGIWDQGNGAKSGKECGWCKAWNTAIAMSKDSRK